MGEAFMRRGTRRGKRGHLVGNCPPGKRHSDGVNSTKEQEIEERKEDGKTRGSSRCSGKI